MSLSSPSSPIVVAMDFDNTTDCITLAKQLNPKYCRLKVGKELFTAAGPQLVEALRELGFEIFLDLKFHDIPNTVAKAIKSTMNLDIWMVNVHASGGLKMLEAAKAAVDSAQSKPLLIAVTVLTSMSAEDLLTLGIQKTPQEQVVHLASLAEAAKLDGVVCSALEAPILKSSFGDNFVCVTPGIRPEGRAVDDQQRIMTPAKALANGSDYLVIGRPITQTDNPALACETILQSLET